MTGFRLAAVPTSAEPSLRASADDLYELDGILARRGVSLRDEHGRVRSVRSLTAAVSKLDMPVDMRIELKRRIERIDLGLPL
jgi:hypothetical protein